MRANDIPIPENWSPLIRKAMIHAISLARAVIIESRDWCYNSRFDRERTRGKLDQARSDLANVNVVLEIVQSRVERIPAHRRPQYTPAERMAILKHKAALGLNNRETAALFSISEATVADWMKRLDEEGDQLLKTREPVNKLSDYFHKIMFDLKTYFPALGKRGIWRYFARAGLNVSATSVGRYIKQTPTPKPDLDGDQPPTPPEPPPRKIKSRHSDHTWLIDLTTVPTNGGFWASWPPNSLPQRHPYCWWVAVIVDHFSRRLVGFAVYPKQPTAEDVVHDLGKAVDRAERKPKYIISDKGSQFHPPANAGPEAKENHAYIKWCRENDIQTRHGKVGEYGSVAITERFIKTMKYEWANKISISYNIDEFSDELALFGEWYNFHRPHKTLDARTPWEVYSNSPPSVKLDKSEEANYKFKLELAFLEDRDQLPIIEIEKIAA